MRMDYRQEDAENFRFINFSLYSTDKLNTISMSFQPFSDKDHKTEGYQSSYLEHFIRSHHDDSYDINILLPNTTFAKYLNTDQISVLKEEDASKPNGTVLELFFNDTYIHSIPISLNVISNWYSKMNNLGKIMLSSDPIGTLDEEKLNLRPRISMSLILIGLAFSTIPVGLSMDIVKDRLVNVS